MSMQQGNNKKVGNVCGIQTIQHYLAAIRRLIDSQRESGESTLRREDIMTENMKALVKSVSNQNEIVMKSQFKERTTGAFEPFQQVQEISAIEEYFWNRNNNARSHSSGALRNRFQFLYTLG